MLDVASDPSPAAGSESEAAHEDARSSTAHAPESDADNTPGTEGAAHANALRNALYAEGEHTEIVQSTEHAGPGRSLESDAQVAWPRRLAGRWILASATLVSALVLVWGLNRPSLDRNEIGEPAQIREPAQIGEPAERSTPRTLDAARESDLSRDAIQGARESGMSPDSADSIAESLKPPADH